MDFEEEEISNISKQSEEEKENYIDIIDIIEKSNKNIIKIKKTNCILKINSNSIKKIFSLIIDKENEILSDMYIDNIIINIYKDKNNSKLENKYITLLEKTEAFQINFDANVNNVQLGQNNNKFEINRKSLTKIVNYLNKSIIDMSDYINLVILYLSNENKAEIAKMTIEQKILEKYKKENIAKKENDINGIKQLNCKLKVPRRNKYHNIYEMDMLFNKVLDYIDDFDKDSSFSDDINNLIIPRKELNEDLIKVVNVSFIDGILPTESDENEKGNKKKVKSNRQLSNTSYNKEKSEACNRQICNGICNIF
jgi:hypothetical protein